MKVSHRKKESQQTSVSIPPSTWGEHTLFTPEGKVFKFFLLIPFGPFPSVVLIYTVAMLASSDVTCSSCS